MYITVFFGFLYFWRIIFLSLYFVLNGSYVLKNIKKMYNVVEMLKHTVEMLKHTVEMLKHNADAKT